MNACSSFVFQVSGIGPEMLLLSNTVEMEDLCWEKRIRCGKHKDVIEMIKIENVSEI